MARVTVEDCILKIPNRFDLVVIAGQRARDISSGSPLTVDRDRDKNPVVALREIADETVDIESLREALVKSHQRQVEVDLPEEDQEFDAAAVSAAMIAPAADADDAPEDDLDLDAFARELAAEAGDFRSRSDQD